MPVLFKKMKTNRHNIKSWKKENIQKNTCNLNSTYFQLISINFNLLVSFNFNKKNLLKKVWVREWKHSISTAIKAMFFMFCRIYFQPSWSKKGSTASLNHNSIISVFLLELKVVSICLHCTEPGQPAHSCSLTRLYILLTKFWSLSSKNWRWIIPFKKLQSDHALDYNYTYSSWYPQIW